MTDFSELTSNAVARNKGSLIRELLKLLRDPEIISFAGGLPDPAFFPADTISELYAKVLRNHPQAALQYGETEGARFFIAQLIKSLKENENIDIKEDQILVTSASQQALDLIGKAFINEGDDIVVARPSYLGALQAFNVYGANFNGVESDNDGVIPDSLNTVLDGIAARGKKCKFVYLVPDFQNPTGTTIPLRRRLEILEIVKKHKTILIEDSPYREIRFRGEAPETFFKLDKGEGNVVTLFTLSKTFAPGLRLGYIIGAGEILRSFVLLKQSMDLCTPPINQLVAAEYMAAGHLKPHVQKIVEAYRAKLAVMIKAFEDYMPEGVTWTHPEGGLFLWITVPEYMDLVDLFPKAVEKKVAYVVGTAFYYDESVRNTMRINFSYCSHEQIVEGVKRLAEMIKENMR